MKTWAIVAFTLCAAAGALLAVALTSCAPGILTPATGPGSDYPCGVGLHQCPRSSLCCSDEETCHPPSSDFPNTGSCEFVGADGTVGVRPQRAR